MNKEKLFPALIFVSKEMGVYQSLANLRIMSWVDGGGDCSCYAGRRMVSTR